MKKGITIIGSSGVGKTTLVRSLENDNRLKNLIETPKRYITREPRLGDNLVENCYVSNFELGLLQNSLSLSVLWERHLDSSMQYAFELPSGNKTPIFSANNATY